MTYYFRTLGNVFRRHPAFSFLIIIIISIGTAASTSMIAVLYTLHADPLPGLSDRIFHPQLEPSVAGHSPSASLPDSLMWLDAMNLLHASAGKRKAVILEGQVTVVPQAGDAHSYFAKAVYTQQTFFGMFQTPFAAGGAWNPAADEQGAHVAVVSSASAIKAFGQTDVVGRVIRLGKSDFQIVGVLGDWDPHPRFYDLANGAFAPADDVFLPMKTSRELGMSPSASPACWGNGMPDFNDLEHAPCTWVEFWVELESGTQRDSYLAFLRHYVSQQKALGRFYGAPRVKLSNVTEWLSSKNIVPGSARLQAFIAYSFLLICILNASGLLLVMFMRRQRELGLRRTLGATKRQIVFQLVAEVSGLALISALSTCLWTWCLLRVIRLRPESYYAYVVADKNMVFAGLTLSLLATLIATFIPAWQVTRGSPYAMLKS